jgi:hypothetical protein
VIKATVFFPASGITLEIRGPLLGQPTTYLVVTPGPYFGTKVQA